MAAPQPESDYSGLLSGALVQHTLNLDFRVWRNANDERLRFGSWGMGNALASAAPIWIGGYLSSGIGVLPGSPVNTVAPVASGALTVGSTLSCTTGTWTNSPASYAYQWRRNGGGIPGRDVLDLCDGYGRRRQIDQLHGDSDQRHWAGSVWRLRMRSRGYGRAGQYRRPGGERKPDGRLDALSHQRHMDQFTSLLCPISGSAVGPTSPPRRPRPTLTVSADGGTSVSRLVTATNSSGSPSQASDALAISAGGATSVWSAADAAAGGMTLSNGGLTVTPFPGSPPSVCAELSALQTTKNHQSD